LVGGLVFLRFINAAIVAPGAYEGLMFDMSVVVVVVAVVFFSCVFSCFFVIVCHCCCCVFVFVIEIFAFSGVLPDTLEITPRAQRNLVIIIIIANSLKHNNKP
jgi:hypothetical protein